ncbi:MAG: LamG-like jellyroll fold domain-containing protein [Bacteroidota bacterium]|nr:LamG-like jellyroll fold domain-containing protein [Bacteroidota bacterium]
MKKSIYSFFQKRVILAALLGTGLLTHFSLDAQDTTTGLILKYSFDNVTGTTVTDDSGNGKAGTLQGAAAVTTGYMGKGIVCTAKADYITAPANINSGLSSFTFSTWVKMTALKNATRFFDWGTGADGTNNFLAFIPSYNGDDQYMALRFRPASGTAINVASTEKCPVGTWAHIAVTYSWNGSSGTGTIYLNGKAVGTASGITFNPSTFLGSTANNYFGYSRWSTDTNGFNGTFDDIRIYNRALTASDVSALTGLEELTTQYNQLSLGDISAVTANLTLPKTMGDKGIKVYWKSSCNKIIDTMGVVTRPNYFDYTATLTATLSNGITTMTKTFTPKILAADGTGFTKDLLVRYDFSNLSGVTVKDVAEKQFSGALRSNATVVTMGTAETGIYNVLKLGATSAYFDMGYEVGKMFSLLSDYTVSAYYRIDAANTSLANAGNMIWCFTNSANASSLQNGYLAASLYDQSLNVTPTYNAGTGNQSLSFRRQALKGNWHHIAYTQKGTLGTIYIDGISMGTDQITNLPVSTLVRESSSGTLYNWIGRSCYASDSYLSNALVYDFRLYKKALTAQEIQQTELNVPANIANLEAAYKAFAGTAKTAETAISDPVIHAVPTYLEILQNDNSTQKIPLTSFSKMTATDAQTSIVLTSGALNFATDDIRKMVLSDGTASVPTVLAKAELSLYPNPATSYIVLHRPEAGQGTISIYSIAGQQVLTLEAGAQDMTIDVSALPQGVYIVKSGIHVAKFSKK